MEGDGFVELPGHAGDRRVKAKALLDAHGAVSHLPQVLPAETGKLELLAPSHCPLEMDGVHRGSHSIQPWDATSWGLHHL